MTVIVPKQEESIPYETKSLEHLVRFVDHIQLLLEEDAMLDEMQSLSLGETNASPTNTLLSALEERLMFSIESRFEHLMSSIESRFAAREERLKQMLSS